MNVEMFKALFGVSENAVVEFLMCHYANSSWVFFECMNTEFLLFVLSCFLTLLFLFHFSND